MRYSLPAIAIDEEELDSIQTSIIPAIVQKLGFSSKLPMAIRYGPISMGGLGLMDIRTECGIEMIKYFRHHVYCQTQVGELSNHPIEDDAIRSRDSPTIIGVPRTQDLVFNTDMDFISTPIPLEP